MSKKMSREELRRLVLDEARKIEQEKKVKKISPAKRKRIAEAKQQKRLLEARTEIAHIELLEEGLFDAVKSFFKTGASMLGKSAAAIGNGIGGMAKGAGEVAGAYATAIKDIADEKVKAVATEFHTNIAKSLQGTIESKSKEMMAALIKAGKTEEEAKQEVATAIQAAMAQALVDTGK